MWDFGLLTFQDGLAFVSELKKELEREGIVCASTGMYVSVCRRSRIRS